MNISCHENYTDQIKFYNQKFIHISQKYLLTKKSADLPQPHEGNYQKVDLFR